MAPFPFSADAWDAVTAAAVAVTNATLCNDNVLRAATFLELQVLLRSLRDVYGEHPILIETEADFTDDPNRARELYISAISLAERENLPTYSMRIALANVLLNNFSELDIVRNQLLACEAEVMNNGDESERNEWRKLLQSCDGGCT